MTDTKKLELIDQMLGNYYEFCSFDDAAMDDGSLRMLMGCIEAVIAFETDGEEAHTYDAEKDYGWKLETYRPESDDDCDGCDSRYDCLREELEESILQSLTLMKELEEMEREMTEEEN